MLIPASASRFLILIYNWYVVYIVNTSENLASTSAVTYFMSIDC